MISAFGTNGFTSFVSQFTQKGITPNLSSTIFLNCLFIDVNETEHEIRKDNKTYSFEYTDARFASDKNEYLKLSVSKCCVFLMLFDFLVTTDFQLKCV